MKYLAVFIALIFAIFCVFAVIWSPSTTVLEVVFILLLTIMAISCLTWGAITIKSKNTVNNRCDLIGIIK